MEAIYKIGIERFKDRYPDYQSEQCVWKPIAESERPTVEGRLVECLGCSGYDGNCEDYVVL